MAPLFVMCMGIYIVATSCMTCVRTSSRDIIAFNAVTCQHIKSRLDRRACVKGCAKYACFSGQTEIQDLHVRTELLYIHQSLSCGVEDVASVFCKPDATAVHAASTECTVSEAKMSNHWLHRAM